MDTATRYTMIVTATCCGYTGSIAAVELHDCAIQQGGGRCEDYPACGHTDGDGCQTLPEHTSAYWLDRPHLLLDGDFDPTDGEWLDEPDTWDER
jgi:hypothetical protein